MPNDQLVQISQSSKGDLDDVTLLADPMALQTKGHIKGDAYLYNYELY